VAGLVAGKDRSQSPPSSSWLNSWSEVEIEPNRTRTCDPLVERAAKPIPSSHGALEVY